MSVETGSTIRSITEAITAARQAKRAGLVIPIEPCVKMGSEGKVITCSNVDPTLSTLCTDSDGIDGRTLQCPKQRGQLTLVATNVSENPW